MAGKNFEEALALLNDSPFGLQAGVFILEITCHTLFKRIGSYCINTKNTE